MVMRLNYRVKGKLAGSSGQACARIAAPRRRPRACSDRHFPTSLPPSVAAPGAPRKAIAAHPECADCCNTVDKRRRAMDGATCAIALAYAPASRGWQVEWRCRLRAIMLAIRARQHADHRGPACGRCCGGTCANARRVVPRARARWAAILVWPQSAQRLGKLESLARRVDTLTASTLDARS